ncbi:MAG: replicative helicase loader/inhibitor [Deltaproteobacteria bacterium]
MTKQDMTKIFAILATTYPQFEKLFENKDKLRFTVEIWHKSFNDIDFNIAEIAVQKLILESPYPPTIADLRKQISDITTPKNQALDPADGWGEVTAAIRNFGYYREEEAIKSLSPLTAKVVRYLNWREICLCEEPGIIRGQFMKMFEQIAKRDKQERLLPNDLKGLIQGLSGKLNLPEGVAQLEAGEQ